MDTVEPQASSVAATRTPCKAAILGPVLAALAYPFLLQAFHGAVSSSDGAPSAAVVALATACLLGALATPLFGLAVAWRLSRTDHPSRFALRARRLAYAGVAAPPMFVFAGVTLGLLGAPVSDTALWIAGWLAALVYGWSAGDGAIPAASPTVARLRFAHGVSAALLAVFVLFHLSNHLTGLLGPAVHTRVMEIGRTVYRSAWIEPVFVGFLLFQVASGIRLAQRWSVPRADLYRAVQVGSGVYLAAYVITHLNSALVSARTVHGIETDWAWASGNPNGLILDAWNIRLLPHYAFGAFFALAHMTTGLRQVLLAHGMSEAKANRIWRAGLAASGAVAATIVGALVGLRV